MDNQTLEALNYLSANIYDFRIFLSEIFSFFFGVLICVLMLSGLIKDA